MVSGLSELVCTDCGDLPVWAQSAAPLSDEHIAVRFHPAHYYRAYLNGEQVRYLYEALGGSDGAVLAGIGGNDGCPCCAEGVMVRELRGDVRVEPEPEVMRDG